MTDLSSKIALVTGASRGIGRAIAMEIAQSGATVIGTATTEKGAQSITDYLAKAGFEKSCGKVLNVSDILSIENLMNNIKNEFGIIEILVNNAAVTRDNLMLRMKLEEWNTVINTNLNSVFHVTRLCLRDMMKNRFGRIINITSVVGCTGNAGQANYAASKAGMIGFTKSLALEVATRGITVNAIAPGFIDTDMTSVLDDKQKTAILSAIPMNRMGQPEEIASMVGFLISDRADYITGQTIHINGGMYL